MNIWFITAIIFALMEINMSLVFISNGRKISKSETIVDITIVSTFLLIGALNYFL